MQEVLRIIINIMKSQVFLTVISGVLVYIISQLFLEEILIPQKKYKELKQRICYNLLYYRCYYLNPLNSIKNEKDSTGKYKEGSEEIRKIGSELAGYLSTVHKIHIIRRKRIDSAYKELIGISNGFYILNYKIDWIKLNQEAEKEIEKTLGIKIQ